MKELKLDCPDLLETYQKNVNNSPVFITEGQFSRDEWIASSTFYIIMLVHQQNCLNIFDTTCLYNQMILGNIHPKDVAFLLDNFNRFHRIYNDVNKPDIDYVKQKGYFGIGVRRNLEPNSLLISDSLINIYRANYLIAPFEQDRAKWKFMEANKMNYFWGYVGTRA